MDQNLFEFPDWPPQNLPMESQQRVVPPCSICDADSSGIHFGVDSCSACSAFFRRTVVLKKKYTCWANRRCVVLQKTSRRQKCRACRFQKCLDVGMNVKAVRISGGSSVIVSPKKEEAIMEDVSGTDVEVPPFQTWSSGEKSIFPHPNSFLNEMIKRQQYLLERRHLFLSEENILDWLSDPKPDDSETLIEIDNLKSNFFHLWTVESRLLAEYIYLNRFFDEISIDDKVEIFKQFFILQQTIEEPYLTWKHGGLEKQFFFMSNRRYIDIQNIDKYAENGCWTDSKLDFDMLKQLVVSMYSSAMENVGFLIKNLQISEMELIILLGLALTDSATVQISEDSRLHLISIRDHLILDVISYYEKMGINSQKRIDELFMVLDAAKSQALKTSENLRCIHCLSLVPLGKVFDNILLENYGKMNKTSENSI